jgi:hypothetical protein
MRLKPVRRQPDEAFALLFSAFMAFSAFIFGVNN